MTLPLSDQEREDRRWCGIEDGWYQDEWIDPADHTVPEPLPSAPDPVRVVGAICGRWTLRRKHGTNWGPCTGKIVDGGGCDRGCVPR